MKVQRKSLGELREKGKPRKKRGPTSGLNRQYNGKQALGDDSVSWDRLTFITSASTAN